MDWAKTAAILPNVKSPLKRALLTEKEEESLFHQSKAKKKAYKHKKREDLKKAELSARDLEFESMKVELVQAKERIEKLEEQILEMEQHAPFEKQMVKNTKILVKSLPSNSPFWQPILFFLGQSVDRIQMMKYYNISKSNYHLIMSGDGSALVSQTYAIDVKCPRITEVQKTEIIRILDDILPFQSGRSY